MSNEIPSEPTIPATPLVLGAPWVENRRIGPYKLLQRIGEGGMGEVWMAEQSEPVKRRVALKVIKQGIGSKEILARFEAERQALSLMNHPNIARILDAGATPDGQSYFAMELVLGKPFTTYCDENRLGINDRLELFSDVCNGVQHAHQKGIIHRDLKPSNILVSVIDGQPVPKVIDFGLAKAMESTQRLTDQSLFTGIGQILGTLKYMSPEQASLDSVDIDTRTDIYALGVILYELMTGSTPLDDSTIKGQASLKVLELIRDKEPVKPSSRLGSSTQEQKSSITNQRRTDSVRLNRVLAGDLDWIVMKALEKDRTRRYETASGFAADIHRYLSNEPVLARPPALGYRVRKFVRKHRVGVSTASLAGLSLIVGLGGTGLGLVRALRAEQAAVDALTMAAAEARAKNKALQEKEAALAAETRQRQYAEAVADFVENDFLALTNVEGQFDLGANLENELGKDATLLELLNRAAEKLEARTDLDPLIEARLRSVIGNSYSVHGDGANSIRFLSKALELRRLNLGSDHPDTITSMNRLAAGYRAAGQLEQAVPLFEKSLELITVQFGPEHPETLEYTRNLAGAYQDDAQLDRALLLYERTFELSRSKLGLDHRNTLASMSDLALGYKVAGQVEKVLPMYEQTLELMKSTLGPDNRNTLILMNNLAVGYRDAGQLDKAIPLLEETLQRRRALYGREHPSTMVVMGSLAGSYRAAGKLDQALPLYEQSLALMQTKLGLDHPKTLTSMNNLALGLADNGQLDKALSLLEETLELTKAKFGPDHPDTLNSMNNLAAAYYTINQLDKALPLFEKTLELTRSKLGPDHPNTLGSMNNLAKVFQTAGQLDKAVPLFEKTLELKQAKLGIEHSSTFTSMINLAVAYREAGQLDKAVPLLETMLPRVREVRGHRHFDTLLVVANLGATYRDAGRIHEGISLLEEAFSASDIHPKLAWVRQELRAAYAKGKRLEQFRTLAEEDLAKARRDMKSESLEQAGVLISIGDGYLQAGAPDIAAQLLREDLAIREKLEPTGWRVPYSQSLLGGALLAQARDITDETKSALLAEAEALLRSSYQGMDARADSIHISIREKIRTDLFDRLIECYTVLDRLDDANMYRELRDNEPDASEGEMPELDESLSSNFRQSASRGRNWHIK